MIKKLFTSIYARYATLLVLALLSANYALGEPKTVKYMQNSTTAASIPTDGGGTAPAGSSIEFKNTYGTKEQLTKDNSMTYTLKGYEGCIIKSLSMSMHSNKSAGTGKFSLVAGSTTLAEIASNTGFNQTAWYGAWSQAYVNVVPTMIKDDYVIQSGENVVLTISASANSLFCQSITITYEEVTASVATPTFSVASGLYANTQSVELSCATDGATIYYTIDGSEPTSSSTEYSTAISVSKSTTIKAVAIKGEEKSNVASASYKITTYANVADLVADGEPTTTGYPVTVTLTNEVIKSFYTSSGYRNGIYLNYTNPGGKDIEIYCKNVPDAWEEGGIVSGTLKNCIWKNYSGTWELCPDNWGALSYTGPATYKININSFEHGSIVATPTVSAAGLEVSLTVAPDPHYELASLSVKDKDDKEIIVKNNKFIMPASDVTVSATFAEKAKFTVTYYSLGVSVGSEQVYNGELIASAPTPTLSGWELVGWTTDNELETSTTAPTAFDLSSPITSVLNLYAIFMKTEGEGGTYVLDYNAESGLSSSTDWGSYGTALDYTAADGSEWVVKAYKNKGMQINTGKNASIKIPDCSANITSIEITCSAKYAVGLSAADYTGTGSISYIATGSDANSQTLDCSGASVTGGYIVAKSGSTSITKIVVNYGNSTTYYTIGNKKVDISDAGWATACLPFNATVSGDVTAYYVEVKDGNLVKTPIAEGEHIVGETGVLLKSNGGSTATATFTAVELDEKKIGDAWYDNMMVGSLIGETFTGNDKTYYILTLGNDDKVGFYWDWETNNSGASAKCPAGKAVLAVPNSSTQAKSFFSLDDEPNGIEDVRSSRLNVQSSIYNLNGVRVNGNYKGLVIIDGKKFMNK